MIGVGGTVGSAIGGYMPLIWGGDAFSYTSIALSGVGGLLGIWLTVKLTDGL